MPNAQDTRTPPPTTSSSPMVAGFPPWFWSIPSVAALQPEVIYFGPNLGSAAIAEMAPPTEHCSYVYVILDFAMTDVFYVGKSNDPATRFANHRATKDWWPHSGSYLALLRVNDSDGVGSENSAYYLERIAIKHLRPIHNISAGRH